MLAANCLAIITQLLQMTINEIMMLLCRTMLLRQNIDKFLLRYKEFYFKITTILNQLSEEISIKSHAKNEINIRYQKIIAGFL